MAIPYVGEIRMFAGNFAPAGWEFCNGQVVPIDLYETLYNLIGTTYGGDGQETFGLPNLCGRLPVHAGNGFVLGGQGGSEMVTLATSQVPTHRHRLMASRSAGVTSAPTGQVLAADGALVYAEGREPVPLGTGSTGVAGGSQPHSNLMPYTCVSFIISAYGIFPSPF
ncbi:phage tail protein [Vulgatibacter incomptus]|uniref:Microcystin dependent protein n=1 Tax=Vulgatibacter incomptus TaxID=1391653 RepID=A0A0K1PEN3_9BACT|nr:tail fiber protein [Vulgatibacter incomptus]AKU91975.1 Microcystin dependent protein [Vulgatibacter incomptus]